MAMAVHGLRGAELSLSRLVDGLFGGVAHVEQWAGEHLAWTRLILLAMVAWCTSCRAGTQF